MRVFLRLPGTHVNNFLCAKPLRTVHILVQAALRRGWFQYGELHRAQNFGSFGERGNHSYPHRLHFSAEITFFCTVTIIGLSI